MQRANLSFAAKLKYILSRLLATLQATLLTPVILLWVLMDTLYRFSNPGLKQVLDLLTFQR
jgi:hypothetical protein